MFGFAQHCQNWNFYIAPFEKTLRALSKTAAKPTCRPVKAKLHGGMARVGFRRLGWWFGWPWWEQESSENNLQSSRMPKIKTGFRLAFPPTSPLSFLGTFSLS